ncbi:hypothetical protein PG984_009862 [Apiospora sp. TS-2023a]
MATNSNTESCQIAAQVNDSGSSTELSIFPHKIPQEVLDKILWYLHLYDFLNMAVTCKNLYEGLLPALYNEHTHTRALVYAARHGRIETFERMQKETPNMMVDTHPYDTETGSSGITFFISWPIKLPPKTSELIMSITNGHPHMAKALIEAGAESRHGACQALVPSGKELSPLCWLIHQMAKTTDADTMKKWKEIMVMLLDIGADACPCPEWEKRRFSALAQSIHSRLPLEITSMLIKRGKLTKEHMLAPYQYQLNNKKSLSPLTMAKQERDQDRDDPSSSGGYGRARVRMIQKVIYQNGKQATPKKLFPTNTVQLLTHIAD